MGGVASKRLKTTIGNSSEFNSACDSTYNECLSLTQHAFDGVFSYQISIAATILHETLTATEYPLIQNWVPSPPSRSQVDSALRVITRQPADDLGQDTEPELLGAERFKEWAVELYGEAVMATAGKKILMRVPIGVAGIVGIGAVTRSAKEVVGGVIGVYAIGVATSIYLALCS